MSIVVTLIANPKKPVLEPNVVKSVSNAINSRNTYWLADGVACDCMLPDNIDPNTITEVIRDTLAGLPIDIVVQQQDQRRKKALIADMDSTMIEQECIDELADEVGLKQQVSEITARAMNGEIPFEPSLRERVALLKGLPVSVIDKVVKNRISLTPGGADLVATMNAKGAFTCLVSGGFTHFTREVAKMLGFAATRANQLVVKNSKLTGEVVEPILGREAKIEALNQLAEQLGLDPADFIAVGDGANDLGMLGAAGSGVALHAKPAVAANADIRIDHGDLTALLYIQGYRKSEFTT